MATKGKKRASGQDTHPSPSKKPKSKADGGGQTALDSFFASPSKPKPAAQPLSNGKSKEHNVKAAQPEIIALSDSDDDEPVKGKDDGVAKPAQQLDEDDEAMAIRLAKEDGIDVEELRRKEMESKTPVKVKERSPPTSLGPMFGSSSKQPPPPRPRRPSVPADPLDKDIFSFDPATIDTSEWPSRSSSSSPSKGKGKAVQGEGPVATPYAFLVEGFGLITSTRSRLYITSPSLSSCSGPD